LKTASLWGPPPSRFYRFLESIIVSCGTNPELTIIGCADGKFVLPAARKGLKVRAIDIDVTALYGGAKPGVDGEVVVPGLVSRLKAEGLLGSVEVICSDFTKINPRPSAAVFTSGSLQYSYNLPKSASELLACLMTFVAPRGLLYIDYMLPYERKYIGRPNCPDAEWWRKEMKELNGWQVLHHRVLPPIRDRAHVEFPVDHFHQWGHVLLRRS
jgi:hypothetical protein